MITVEIPVEWLNKEMARNGIKPGMSRISINGAEHTIMQAVYHLVGGGGLELSACSHDEMEARRVPVLEAQIQMLQAKLDGAEG